MNWWIRTFCFALENVLKMRSLNLHECQYMLYHGSLLLTLSRIKDTGREQKISCFI